MMFTLLRRFIVEERVVLVKVLLIAIAILPTSQFLLRITLLTTQLQQLRFILLLLQLFLLFHILVLFSLSVGLFINEFDCTAVLCLLLEVLVLVANTTCRFSVFRTECGLFFEEALLHHKLVRVLMHAEILYSQLVLLEVAHFLDAWVS